MDKQSDIIIVSFHGGAEGKNTVHLKMKRRFF